MSGNTETAAAVDGVYDYFDDSGGSDGGSALPPLAFFDDFGSDSDCGAGEGSGERGGDSASSNRQHPGRAAFIYDDIDEDGGSGGDGPSGEPDEAYFTAPTGGQAVGLEYNPPIGVLPADFAGGAMELEEEAYDSWLSSPTSFQQDFCAGYDQNALGWGPHGASHLLSSYSEAYGGVGGGGGGGDFLEAAPAPPEADMRRPPPPHVAAAPAPQRLPASSGPVRCAYTEDNRMCILGAVNTALGAPNPIAFSLACLLRPPAVINDLTREYLCAIARSGITVIRIVLHVGADGHISRTVAPLTPPDAGPINVDTALVVRGMETPAGDFCAFDMSTCFMSVAELYANPPLSVLMDPRRFVSIYSAWVCRKDIDAAMALEAELVACPEHFGATAPPEGFAVLNECMIHGMSSLDYPAFVYSHGEAVMNTNSLLPKQYVFARDPMLAFVTCRPVRVSVAYVMRVNTGIPCTHVREDCNPVYPLSYPGLAAYVRHVWWGAGAAAQSGNTLSGNALSLARGVEFLVAPTGEDRIAMYAPAEDGPVRVTLPTLDRIFLTLKWDDHMRVTAMINPCGMQVFRTTGRTKWKTSQAVVRPEHYAVAVLYTTRTIADLMGTIRNSASVLTERWTDAVRRGCTSILIEVLNNGDIVVPTAKHSGGTVNRNIIFKTNLTFVLVVRDTRVTALSPSGMRTMVGMLLNTSAADLLSTIDERDRRMFYVCQTFFNRMACFREANAGAPTSVIPDTFNFVPLREMAYGDIGSLCYAPAREGVPWFHIDPAGSPGARTTPAGANAYGWKFIQDDAAPERASDDGDDSDGGSADVSDDETDVE